MVFLSNCIDPSSIYGRVQTMLNWLDATQEGDRLVGRAKDRLRICRCSPSSPVSQTGRKHLRSLRQRQ